MKLFDDVDDDDTEKISNIGINEEFAKRYEHNKKREDLQKLEEMKKKGELPESESDSEWEEDDDIESTKNEVKFLDALLKVRNKDPILLEKDAKLFESSSDEEDDEVKGDRKEKKKKPKYLKDVIAEQLIERGPEYEGEEEESEEEEREMKKVKSYAEEQEDFRKEVLAAMADEERENEEEGGELLREKERDEDEDEDEEVTKRLDEYFGEDEKLDENDVFLKEFFKNKMWIDKENGKNKVIEEDVAISDDEEALEKQEDYERDFNFRFEENVSDRVLGHSRSVVGSVRKETNARKNQRERKKERMAEAEIERQEEVKRLKNLKRKEMQEKINKIREIAGIDKESVLVNEDDLEEDFDPEKFDKKMNAAFGKDYYEADDPEFANESDSDLEKPDFEKEDELLGLPEDWGVIKSSDGFVAERERMKKSKVENEIDVDQVQGGEDDGGQLDEGKKRRKRKKSSIKEALDKELEEELYKLDYEDTIGDLKTRFKYRDVRPAKYGLTAAEILMLDEKELNQYVSLKKLAPYREKEWKVPQMRKKMLFEGLLNDNKNQKKRKRNDGGNVGETSEKKSMEVKKAEGEEPSIDESKLSRAARRRRRMKEKKLPESRLIAYGKIPSSSKNKSKN